MTEATKPNPVALVTGASGGIGSAVALRLARLGTDLMLCYGKNHETAQTVGQQCRSLGCRVELMGQDLSKVDAAVNLVAACVERFSAVDIMVHCAGIVQESLLATLDDVMLSQLINTNIISTVALTRAVLRPMLQQRHGRIVLLSSVVAQKPSQGAAVYAGCKGFIEGFTRAMAVEVGRKGILVNAVAPGIVETPMTISVRGLVGDDLSNRCSLKRFALPDEIAAAILYLCGSDSSFVNGHVLAVDGAYLGPP